MPELYPGSEENSNSDASVVPSIDSLASQGFNVLTDKVPEALRRLITSGEWRVASNNKNRPLNQCCGSESEIIRMFWLDPNPKKSSDSDTDSDSDTVG
jgi:hypothetical protein